VEGRDDSDRRIGQKLPHDAGMPRRIGGHPGRMGGVTAFQRRVRETTFSPDDAPGSSMARRDKTSAWSAIYLL
jgi:hypothetical protein